ERDRRGCRNLRHYLHGRPNREHVRDGQRPGYLYAACSVFIFWEFGDVDRDFHRADQVMRSLASPDDSGNAAIEFAFILPAVLVFIVGLFQGGILLWTQTALHYAVQQAAHCASNNTATCGTSSQIKSYAASISGASFDSSNFTVTTPSCGNQVAASYSMSLV